jgi:CheY-like chemotaxis protein
LFVGFTRSEAPREKIRPVSAVKGNARGLRVIMAEDNPVNQLVQHRMLVQLGYECEIASNGIELLQALEKQAYDLVLLDIQMPVMDGLETARALRARGDRTRLVALTADVTTETRQAAVAAGIDEHLSKPLRIEALGEALERAEAAREAAAAAALRPVPA